MSKVINTSTKYILTAIFVAIATNLTSCSPSPDDQTINPTIAPTPNNQTPITSTPTASPTPTVGSFNIKPNNQSSPSPDSTPSPTTDKTVDVTLYTSDSQCQELIPQKAEVSATTPINAAVGQILEKQDSADLNFTGYRVNVKNGVATVDLRLSPDAKRSVASLSSCEQFAIFGSLRKTLTSNPQWGIKTVRFTEKGEEIIF